jgi:hypothetical protein
MLDGSAYAHVLSDPDPETATRVGWILTAMLFLLGVVSIAGELLGWWNDLGEIGALVGTLGSLVVGVATYQHGADRAQVKAVHEAVRGNGETLASLDEKADLQLDKLDELDELDRIQVELDRQTDVLDRQVEILGEIRDGL